MTTISRIKAVTTKKSSKTKIKKATKDTENNNINNSVVTKKIKVTATTTLTKIHLQK